MEEEIFRQYATEVGSVYIKKGRERKVRSRVDNWTIILQDAPAATIQPVDTRPAGSEVAQGTFPSWATFYEWRSLSLIAAPPWQSLRLGSAFAFCC